MITPLCTQGIYEGLLDDYFGINFNSIKVDHSIIDKESKTDSIKLDLSRKEKFYTKIKDYNFNRVKTFVSMRLKEHSKLLEESKENKLDFKKLQDSLENIKLLKEERPSLVNQINLADYISKNQKIPKNQQYLNYEQILLAGDSSSTFYEFIEDELANKSELYNLLRIICLDNMIHGGMKLKLYDQIKRDIINIYGFQEIFLLHNLEKMKILKVYDGNAYYGEMNKKLKLINESVDLNNPNDPSYSYSGYCPMIIRLIEKAFTKGWNSIKDLLNKIPGEYQYPTNENQIINDNTQDRKYILLVFVGGLTYGELASIRYLSKNMKNKKFIVITTSMINNKKIFNSLRQGKYKYIISDDHVNSNKDSNSFKINVDNRLTFKDFSEQISNK
jgi:hypothetical protein